MAASTAALQLSKKIYSSMCWTPGRLSLEEDAFPASSKRPRGALRSAAAVGIDRRARPEGACVGCWRQFARGRRPARATGAVPGSAGARPPSRRPRRPRHVTPSPPPVPAAPGVCRVRCVSAVDASACWAACPARRVHLCAWEQETMPDAAPRSHEEAQGGGCPRPQGSASRLRLAPPPLRIRLRLRSALRLASAPPPALGENVSCRVPAPPAPRRPPPAPARHRTATATANAPHRLRHRPRAARIYPRLRRCRFGSHLCLPGEAVTVALSFSCILFTSFTRSPRHLLLHPAHSSTLASSTDPSSSFSASTSPTPIDNSIANFKPEKVFKQACWNL
ncbi:Protein of unknown function [Gryllus bimaculatus]|nr:Protein of unknown function [Gryllus bimaculatus]